MKSTAKTVGLVMIVMVMSRLLSLLSIQIYMAYFGTQSIEINIYSYAIQLPNILFASIGTALSTVVIPIFAGHMANEQKASAYKFADNIISLTLVFTICLTVVGFLAAPLLPYFTKYRYEGYSFAVTALRIMFPVMIFYGLNYILQGILQSMGRFSMPAFVSVPSSVIIIGYVYFFGSKFKITGLLVATLIGLSLQAFVLIPPTLKTGYRFKPSFNFKNQDVKNALKLVPPVIVGTSVYQLNMFFNVTIISLYYERMLTLLMYSQYLILYSVLALVYSLTAVIFPILTRHAAKNDMEAFKQSLRKILKSLLYFMIPATAGFVSIRYQLIDFLAGWGKVSSSEVDIAAGMLAFYALGIVGVSLKEVIDRAFYSIKDTKTPALNGIAIMVVNISACLVLIKFMGVFGIPLAYSISSLAGGFFIIYLLQRKIGVIINKNFVIDMLKIIASSLSMLVCVILVSQLLSKMSLGNLIIDKSVKLLVPTVIGGLFYICVTWLLKLEEAKTFATKIMFKIRRNEGSK